MIERRNVPVLAPTPGYSHVAFASEGRPVLTAGGVPLDGDGNLVGPRDLVWGVVQESGVAAVASTLLGVPLLGYEGQLVEIEAVAVARGRGDTGG